MIPESNLWIGAEKVRRSASSSHKHCFCLRANFENKEILVPVSYSEDVSSLLEYHGPKIIVVQYLWIAELSQWYQIGVAFLSICNVQQRHYYLSALEQKVYCAYFFRLDDVPARGNKFVVLDLMCKNSSLLLQMCLEAQKSRYQWSVVSLLDSLVINAWLEGYGSRSKSLSWLADLAAAAFSITWFLFQRTRFTFSTAFLSSGFLFEFE